MSIIVDRLSHFLDHHGVPYQMIHHHRDYSAQTAAHDTHTPGHAFIKPVILKVDAAYVMAVVPADRHVDLESIADWLDAEEVRLATEQETFSLFPDCEVGAESPLGNLYGLPVIVDVDVADNPYVTFNGGTHETAVRMAWEDYARLVQPGLLEMAME